MTKWQVSYKSSGRTITRFYKSMASATYIVAKLAEMGIEASASPTMEDRPEYGKLYSLTGGKGQPCVFNGNTWAESEIVEK